MVSLSASLSYKWYMWLISVVVSTCAHYYSTHTCYPPYPGLLQILFLAGATHHPIQQHCFQTHEVYNLQLPPCACCESYRELLHIMWVRFDDDNLYACGTQPNHIIPLLPTSKDGTRFLHTLVWLVNNCQINFQMLLK